MLRWFVTGLTVFSALQSPLVAQSANDSLVIRVEGRAPLVLRAAELRALPRDSIRGTMKHGEGLFRGPSVKDVFKLAGIALDSIRGPKLAQYALFEASDGYRVVLGLSELSEDISARRMLIADEVDGKPLPGTAGPWQLIVAGDSHPTRWIHSLVSISVRKAP